jgi:membrane protease YdiL (CAAX protease family)
VPLERALSHPVVRPLLAYAFIWLLFLAVPAARAVVRAQFRWLSSSGARLTIAKGAACGAALVVLDAALLVWFDVFDAGGWHAGWGALGVAAGYAAAVAATEEMIVRGVLLTRLREVTRDWAAVGATAGVFAVMHVGRADFGVPSMLEYAVDGILLGWLAIATGSIWAGTALHMMKNLGVIVCFGTTKHLVTPALAAGPRAADRAMSAAADLAAYAIAVALALLLFRRHRWAATRRAP